MFAITLGPFVNIFDYDRPVRPALRKRLRTHKIFTKRTAFYLNILSSVINKFSIKSNVVDVYQNRRGEEILIPIPNI